MDMRQNCNSQNELLVSYFIAEYEKNCLSEYIGGSSIDSKFIFAQSTDSKKLELQAKIVSVYLLNNVKDKPTLPQKEFVNRDELKVVHELIRQEVREISAFIESMESRRTFKEYKDSLMKKLRDLKSDENKIIAGKSSLRSVFSKKTKEESASVIKLQIESTEAEITKSGEIQDIMTVILGYVEIDKFKVTFSRGFSFSFIPPPPGREGEGVLLRSQEVRNLRTRALQDRKI